MKNKLIYILFFIVIIGLFISVYMNKNYMIKIDELKYNYSPINSLEQVDLDVNSILVKNLYKKVQTNIREDIAEPNFNDSMKRYLAYRQVLDYDKYDSNCNLFDSLKMEPFFCNNGFTPKAFKEDTLIFEYKKLFGEDSNIQLNNIQLGNSCIGGYQYIQSRGELVQGYCNQLPDTSYKVTKTVTKAYVQYNNLVLVEKVNYHGNEGMEVPSYLKNGLYYYYFHLDKNYNYILLDKVLENNY